MQSRRIRGLAASMLLIACSIAIAQKPISLIGKDLSGWKTRDERSGWKIEQGLLVNRPPSSDIYTTAKFWNFDLHYEYMIPRGSNSGMYLRGRYEIQILDDFGKEPSPGGNGSIYGQTTAKSNSGKVPGEWNVVDVKLVDHKVTVKLNGVVIVDNVTLTGPTGGALDDRVNEPGPIMLQGDHGGVSFRNIRVKKLPGEPPKASQT